MTERPLSTANLQQTVVLMACKHTFKLLEDIFDDDELRLRKIKFAGNFLENEIRRLIDD